MADFVQTMKDWYRMCETIRLKNRQQTSPVGWCQCNGCPIQGVCFFNALLIENITDKKLTMIGERIQSWAEENPKPEYPLWGDYLAEKGELRRDWRNIRTISTDCSTKGVIGWFYEPIPADIAEKLGIEPKRVK